MRSTHWGEGRNRCESRLPSCLIQSTAIPKRMDSYVDRLIEEILRGSGVGSTDEMSELAGPANPQSGGDTRLKRRRTDVHG